MEKFNENVMYVPEGSANAPAVPAKDTLCEIIDKVIIGIDVFTLLAKRWWLKLALGIVKTALLSFKEQFCSENK